MHRRDTAITLMTTISIHLWSRLGARLFQLPEVRPDRQSRHSQDGTHLEPGGKKLLDALAPHLTQVGVDPRDGVI
jgi:hypothetical protein